MNFELFLIASLAVLTPLWEKAIKEMPWILEPENYPTYEDFAMEVWVTLPENIS